MYNVDKLIAQKTKEIDLSLGGDAVTLILVVHSRAVYSATNKTPALAAMLAASFTAKCCEQFAANEANQSRIITPEN